MTKSTEILEALKMQPLTEEEKASRHILGRWYGPIATCNESTRNGRRYNRELWEKALSDELFHEKIANKCLFLELGHPQDREETDMSKVCACIPEMPRIIDGDLCAFVDILDTPNGRILKTLCDYGFVPGISSRGSGDIMPNDDVDPETFFLETFDIVNIPAVKKARLSMCESLDKNTAKLKKALTESINKASEEDKAIMKETLENLNIDIEASEEAQEELTEKRLSVDEIPWDPEEAPEVLTEDAEDEVEEEAAEAEEAGDYEVEVENDSEESADETPAEEEVSDVEETEKAEEAATEEDAAEEAEASVEDVIVDVDSTEEVAVNTVADAIEQLQEYDDDMEVQFEPVQIDGKEYVVDKLETFVDEEDNILVVGVNCEEAEESSDDAETNIDDVQTEDEETSVETIEPVEDNEESAEDDGDAEVIESLKEMVRQKEALETEISDLRKAKTVGDAKEQELQEKLARYRNAFRTTSAEAAKVPELQSKVKELTEQLTQSNATIKTLTEKVNKAQQLKEGADNGKAKITRLNEQVSSLTKKSEALEAKLEGQTKQYTTKLQERTELAKKYKARFIETLTKYIESKASMLGVQPSEITSRLNENYTLADVDAVCDQILDSTVNFSRLPFGGRTKTSARIAESVSRPSRKGPEYGYEIDDDLLELAGLKR